jgi:alcohol dehydrogenase class IV
MANSRQGLRLVANWLRQSYEQPGDVEARRGVLYGAHFAGRGLNAGVVLGHSIGYTIANRAAVSHGISCAMALPYCLRYALPAAETMLGEAAFEAIGRRDVSALLSWIWQLNDDLNVPATLSGVGIDASAEELADECMERYPRPNNPAPLERRRLVAMYRAMADGDRAAAPFGE